MPPKASKSSLQGLGQNSVSFSSGVTRGWASKAPASARSRGNGMACRAALCALICTTVPSSCVGISTNRAPMGFVGVPNPQLRRRLAPSSLHVLDGATRDSSIARGIGVGQVVVALGDSRQTQGGKTPREGRGPMSRIGRAREVSLSMIPAESGGGGGDIDGNGGGRAGEATEMGEGEDLLDETATEGYLSSLDRMGSILGGKGIGADDEVGTVGDIAKAIRGHVSGAGKKLILEFERDEDGVKVPVLKRLKSSLGLRGYLSIFITILNVGLVSRFFEAGRILAGPTGRKRVERWKQWWINFFRSLDLVEFNRFQIWMAATEAKKAKASQQDLSLDLLDLSKEERSVGENFEPSQAYLDSLYRFTDDGRRLSSISRYAEDYWTINLLNFFKSRVFKRILPHLRANIIVCIMVAFIYTVRPDLPALAGPLHTITGSFLGLLIAFRTNTGYERFWEARKIWESVQNKCRNMARIITSYVINKDDQVLQILQIIATYPYALKQHLRGQRNLDELFKVMPQADVAVLASSNNMPLTLCMLLSVSVRKLLLAPGGTTPQERYIIWEQCDLHIKELISAVGASERLATTPVPLSYSRHTSRFLSIWTLTLPFFMVTYCSPFVLVTAYGFVCWALFGTEEVGHIIEEPFGSPASRASKSNKYERASENLPLLRYCEAIRNDIEELKNMFMLLPTTAPACLVSYDESSEDSEFYEDMVTDGEWNKKMRIRSSRPGGQFINVELPPAAAIGAATDVPVASISGAGLPTAPSSDVSVPAGVGSISATQPVIVDVNTVEVTEVPLKSATLAEGIKAAGTPLQNAAPAVNATAAGTPLQNVAPAVKNATETETATATTTKTKTPFPEFALQTSKEKASGGGGATEKVKPGVEQVLATNVEKKEEGMGAGVGVGVDQSSNVTSGAGVNASATPATPACEILVNATSPDVSNVSTSSSSSTPSPRSPSPRSPSPSLSSPSLSSSSSSSPSFPSSATKPPQPPRVSPTPAPSSEGGVWGGGGGQMDHASNKVTSPRGSKISDSAASAVGASGASAVPPVPRNGAKMPDVASKDERGRDGVSEGTRASNGEGKGKNERSTSRDGNVDIADGGKAKTNTTLVEGGGDTDGREPTDVLVEALEKTLTLTRESRRPKVNATVGGTPDRPRAAVNDTLGETPMRPATAGNSTSGGMPSRTAATVSARTGRDAKSSGSKEHVEKEGRGGGEV